MTLGLTLVVMVNVMVLDTESASSTPHAVVCISVVGIFLFNTTSVWPHLPYGAPLFLLLITPFTFLLLLLLASHLLLRLFLLLGFFLLEVISSFSRFSILPPFLLVLPTHLRRSTDAIPQHRTAMILLPQVRCLYYRHPKNLPVLLSESNYETFHSDYY